MLTKLSSSKSSYASYIQKLSVNHTITSADIDNLYPPYTIPANLASMWMLERNLNWQQTDLKLSGVQVPELVLWGKNDTVLNPSKFTARWHQLAPHATIIQLNKAGHLVYTDQPTQVTVDIRQFLARVAD